ncbi:uncharacterized protein KGF55_001351 [Candida pseudojiufengensis]|uniref:uncharacterized protein n=1 Tax=Candida pseudojiufengensis TaxID=497109 RepID=UPI0022241CB7|nr:uncharacterized protein KGF55_001351 [Candida pseudojiufengensis]KAI5965131.1 hypothetical protein KGF55_001351 [Candida pseudojiufengensis]
MKNLSSQQQQIFNQTPQTQYQQPPSSADKRNFTANSFNQQQQQQQQFQSPVNNQVQSQQTKLKSEKQNSKKPIMTPSQSFSQQPQPLQNSTRPGLQRNANFSGSPISSQSIQTNGQQAINNNNNGNSLQKSNNNNNQNQPHSSNNNSQGHTPIIGNQQPPKPPQPQQQIPPQAQGQVIPPQQQQQQQPQQLQQPNRMNQSPMYQQQPPPQFNNFGIPPGVNLANLSPAQRQMLMQQQMQQQQQQQQQQQPLHSQQPFQQQFHPQQQMPKQQIPPSQQQQQGIMQQQQQIPQSKPNNINSLNSNEIIQQQELNTRIIKRNLGNAASMRVLDLIDFITNENFENLKHIEFWQRIIPAYFIPNAILKLNFKKVKVKNKDKDGKDKNENEKERDLSEITGLDFEFLKNVSTTSTTTPKASTSSSTNQPSSPNNENDQFHNFEINISTIPYFLTKSIENSTISKFQIFITNLKFQVLNNGSVIIFAKLTINLNYIDNSIKQLLGNFKVLMSKDLRIEWINIEILKYENLFNFESLTNQNNNDLNKIFENSITNQNQETFGLDKNSIKSLQINDIFNSMRHLIEFSHLNNLQSPQRALELVVNSNTNLPNQQQQPPTNGQQPIRNQPPQNKK